jgi:hypothetical protein
MVWDAEFLIANHLNTVSPNLKFNTIFNIRRSSSLLIWSYNLGSLLIFFSSGKIKKIWAILATFYLFRWNLGVEMTQIDLFFFFLDSEDQNLQKKIYLFKIGESSFLGHGGHFEFYGKRLYFFGSYCFR